MSDFGEISLAGPTASVRFDRWYPFPPAELWAALTDADRMRRWLGAEVRIEGVPGGEVRLQWEGGDEMHGVITVFEPERLLEYTWSEDALGVESVVRFELRPEQSGTALVLQHTRVPADQAAGFGAGWHGHLDALAAILAGRTADPHERFSELRPVYASRSAKSGSR